MMEKNFKKYSEYLSKDEAQGKKINSLKEIKNQYNNKIIDYYDFIDEMHKYNKKLFLYSDFLESTDIQKIEIEDNTVIFTTKRDGLRILFDGKDRRGVPFEIINWGEYEKPERQLFDNIISNGMTLFDIGSNLGWYSVLWGKKYRNSKIWAFEPIKGTYQYCLANIILNGLQNVDVYNFGLFNERGKKYFFYSPHCAALASTQNIMRYKGSKKINCQVETLDFVSRSLNITNIDLIKCDVEGAELMVIQGGLKTIRRNLPIIVLELYHEWSRWFKYHPNDVFDLLYSLNYQAFLPMNGKLEKVAAYIGDDFERQNYFFLNKIKHEKIISEFLFSGE